MTANQNKLKQGGIDYSNISSGS